MVLWAVSAVGLLIGLYGLMLVRRTILKTKGRLRHALILFFATDASYMVYNAVAAVLGSMGVPVSDPRWYVFIAIHAIPGATWLISMHGIYSISKRARGE